mgnify:CR=1 FL=1
MKSPKYNINDFRDLSEYCTSVKKMKEYYGNKSFTFEDISTKFDIVTKHNFIKHLNPNRIQEFFDSHIKTDCLKDYEVIKKMIPELISQTGSAKFHKELLKRQTERLSIFDTKEDLVNEIDLLKTWKQNRLNESQVLYTLEYFFKQSFQYQSYETTNHIMYRVLCSLLAVCSFSEDDFSNITQKFNFGYWGGNYIESFYAEAVINRNISAWKSIEKYLNRKPFIIKSKRMYEGATFYDKNECIEYRCTGWNDKGKIKFVYNKNEKQKRLSFDNKEFRTFFKNKNISV